MAKLVVFLQETTAYLGYLADHVSRDIDLAINPLPTPPPYHHQTVLTENLLRSQKEGRTF